MAGSLRSGNGRIFSLLLLPLLSLLGNESVTFFLGQQWIDARACDLFGFIGFILIMDLPELLSLFLDLLHFFLNELFVLFEFVQEFEGYHHVVSCIHTFLIISLNV